MLNSICLDNSSNDIFIDDPPTAGSAEPVFLQKRRKALRQRLLSRSQQPLMESSTYQGAPEKIEIDIKSRGLEFGKLHSSLVGGRENCFFIKVPNGDTRVLAAASQEERKCWLTRYVLK